MNQVNDRFAFQQGGHFFYPKEGETLNQNWIVENLNNAFSTWNGKLTELWGLVTTSPQTFKGGAVWGVMQSLHNAMIGIHNILFPFRLQNKSGGSFYGTTTLHCIGFLIFPASLLLLLLLGLTFLFSLF